MSFLVEDNFWVKDRGLVVTGKSDGFVRAGDFYELEDGEKFEVRGVERFIINLGKPPIEGEPVGLLVRHSWGGWVHPDTLPCGTTLIRCSKP